MLSVHLSDPPEAGCLSYLRSLLSADIQLTLGDDCPEHVVFSPHRGGDSAESERLRMEHLADLLNALARGKDLPEPVNIEAGY